ncbi:MAG: hypothetical protein SFV51_23485 [Bryobacteraceae bacterium]|nr:hypothetical protein [Bryobacteraceae bacterium]
MQIRKSQMEAFGRDASERFPAEVADHIRSTNPRAIEGLSRQELERRVNSGIARARRHGLRSKSSLKAFVNLMFSFAPNFDEHPPILAVLRDPGVPADDRVSQLPIRTTEEDWRQVLARRDDDAWNQRAGA